MPVVWRIRTLADVGRIVRHIAAGNAVAAKRVGRELLAGDSLAMFPCRGRAGRLSGTRELTAINPYLIVYRIADRNTVIILRVWHAAQDQPSSA